MEKCGKMWKNVEKCVKMCEMCENVLETRFLYTTNSTSQSILFYLKFTPQNLLCEGMKNDS